jgi:hypothetical protein
MASWAAGRGAGGLGAGSAAALQRPPLITLAAHQNRPALLGREPLEGEKLWLWYEEPPFENEAGAGDEESESESETEVTPGGDEDRAQPASQAEAAAGQAEPPLKRRRTRGKRQRREPMPGQWWLCRVRLMRRNRLAAVPIDKDACPWSDFDFDPALHQWKWAFQDPDDDDDGPHMGLPGLPRLCTPEEEAALLAVQQAKNARWLALKRSRDARLVSRRAEMLELVHKNPVLLLRLIELSPELRPAMPGSGARPRKFLVSLAGLRQLDMLKQTRRERLAQHKAALRAARIQSCSLQLLSPLPPHLAPPAPPAPPAPVAPSADELRDDDDDKDTVMAMEVLGAGAMALAPRLRDRTTS